MSERSDELRICPHCGQENSPQTLRCIRCGQELEDLFQFDGLGSSDTQFEGEAETPLEPMSDLLASLDEDPLLGDRQDKEDEPSGGSESSEDEENDQNQVGFDKPIPDWLEKVRQRAQEENAGGELAQGGQAIDQLRSSDERKQVDAAFDEIMRRIREQSEREKARLSRRVESDLVDENGDPEWLRRIRALQPRKEEEDTKELNFGGSSQDTFFDDWTDDELEELLQKEISQYQAQSDETTENAVEQKETEPSESLIVPPVLETKEVTPDEDEDLPVESESLEDEAAGLLAAADESTPEDDFHNIPDDEFYEGEALEEVEPLEPQAFPPEPVQEEEIQTEDSPEDLGEPSDQTDSLENESSEQELTTEALEPEDEGQAKEAEINLSEVQEPEINLAETSVQESETESAEAQEVEPDAKEPEAEEETQADESLNLDEPVSTEDVLPDLLLLRDQRERAKTLSNIIGQEGKRTISVLHEDVKQNKFGRLVLALLLLAGIIVSLLFGPGAQAELPLTPHAIAFVDTLNTIKTGEKVLIVLDYQAGTSYEIEALSRPVLKTLDEKGAEIQLVTAQPADLWLGRSLLDGEGLQKDLKIEFIPGGKLGFLSLAAGAQPEWGSLPLDQALAGVGNPLAEMDQVILISDSAEFVRAWLEQVQPWNPSIETSAISTAASSALLLPYFESGQLQGFVAGIPDSQVLSLETNLVRNQRAWQAGMMIMIIILLLGMIMKADDDSQKKQGEVIQ